MDKTNDARAHATRYVDTALRRQRALGYEARPDDESYRRAVKRVEIAFRGLMNTANGAGAKPGGG